MKNKEIQEARMKGYFIDATKSILRGEGLKALSVRSVADQAGYSYATMYNCFKDINDLVFVCVKDFQDEIEHFVEDKIEAIPAGLGKLRAAINAYVAYFVEYPGIFELFFIARGGEFGNKATIIEIIDNSLENAGKSEWEYCVENNLISREQAAFKIAQLKYTITGLLLFYLNRRIPVSHSDFIEISTGQIDQVLN